MIGLNAFCILPHPGIPDPGFGDQPDMPEIGEA